MPDSTDEPTPLRPKDVARRFGVSVVTVRKWADLERLPHFRTPSGQRRFWAEDVDAFFAERASQADKNGAVA